jgi:hypothetical protein
MKTQQESDQQDDAKLQSLDKEHQTLMDEISGLKLKIKNRTKAQKKN